MNYLAFQQQLQKGTLQDVYFLYGEEKLLRIQALQALEKAVLPAGMEDFNKDVLEGDAANRKTIAETAMNLPFLAEKRLLIVRGPLPLLNKAAEGDDELLAYLQNPNPQCCLVFDAEEPLKGNTKLGKAMKPFEVECAPLKNKELADWIRNYIGNRGRRMDNAAIGYLTSVNKLDLQCLEQELEKLLLYVPAEEEIRQQHVEDIVTKTLEANVFALVETLCRRNVQGAIDNLHRLLEEGEPVPMLLAFLQGQFRNMLLYKSLREQGYSEDRIKEVTGKNPYVIKKGLEQARNFTERQLEDFLDRLLEIEATMKSSSVDVGLLLDRFVMDVCDKSSR